MRRSFGGRGMGGGSGGGGGGGMIRNVHRAVRAGVGGAPPEPFSPSPNTTTTIASSANSRKPKNFNSKQPTSPNAALALSASSSCSSSSSSSSPSANGGGGNYNGTSAFSSLINLPASTTCGAPAPSSLVCSDESEWECVDDGTEDERARAFYQDFVFGTVPSTDEVHHAVSALQQVLESSYKRFPEGELAEDIDEVGNAIIGSERRISSMDWIEPSSFPYNSKMVQPRGSDRVYDAFHLLQNDPSVQRMVISLSSDKAAWDAVLNNEVVKELTGSTNRAGTTLEEGSDEGPDGSNPVNDMLSWIVVNCKAKIMQLVDKMAMFMNEFVQLPSEEKKGDDTTVPLDEKLKSCVLLSIAVLFIVVITRAQGA